MKNNIYNLDYLATFEKIVRNKFIAVKYVHITLILNQI